MGTYVIFAELIFVATALAQVTTGTVSGQVHDITGAAVVSAKAALTMEQPPHTLFSARTDSDGEFRFTIPPGTYTLELVQPGFKTLTLKSIQVVSGEQERLSPLRVDVGGCPSPTSIDYLEILATEQGVGNLRGRVLREQKRYPGPPVARATVKLLCSGRNICGETKTDSYGDFSFFDLPPGTNFTVNVSKHGYYPLEEPNYEVRAGFSSIYPPSTLEPCHNGNCDPRLRPKRPLGLCE